MTFEERLRAQGIKVNGTFDVQNFFDTFARILSRKYGIEITVTITRENEVKDENKEVDNSTQAS